jgi:hypothetical protein
MEKNQDISRNHGNQLCTYNVSGVALECAVIDLHSGTILSINSSALEIACPPPEIGVKKVQESSETNLELLTD